MRSARSGSPRTSPRAAPRAAGSRIATMRPVTPSSTASAVPPASVATTGRAARMASSTVTGSPSRTDDSTNASLAAIKSAASVRAPSHRTRSSSPARRTCSSSAPPRRPSPAIHRRARGTRGAIHAKDSISTCCALAGVRLPMVSAMRSSGATPISRRTVSRGRVCGAGEMPLATVTKRRAAQGMRRT